MQRFDAYGRVVENEGSQWFIVVAAWITVLLIYFLYVPNHFSPLKFPGPILVVGALQNIGVDLIGHAGATLALVVSGFAFGSIIGVLIGFLMFSLRWADALLFSFLEFMRPVPPLALIPFFILWFQLNPSGQVVLVALGCFMVLAVSTRESLNKVSIDTRRAARSLGATGFSFYVQVLVWAIMPSLIAPLRVALALAFALAIAAEFMGAQSGLGVLMMIARRTLQTETILLSVMVLGFESAMMDFLLRALMRRLTRWQQ